MDYDDFLDESQAGGFPQYRRERGLDGHLATTRLSCSRLQPALAGQTSAMAAAAQRRSRGPRATTMFDVFKHVYLQRHKYRMDKFMDDEIEEKFGGKPRPRHRDFTFEEMVDPRLDDQEGGKISKYNIHLLSNLWKRHILFCTIH